MSISEVNNSKTAKEFLKELRLLKKEFVDGRSVEVRNNFLHLERDDQDTLNRYLKITILPL